MNRRTAMLAIAGAGLGAAASAPLRAAPAAPIQPGDRVRWPEVSLLDGTRWNAARAEGKAVVVVFWATTCPFCRQHNAHVEKLRVAAAGRPLELLTVARDRDLQAVRQYLARTGWRFAVTMDSGPMAEALSTRNLIPLTVTVDRSGRLKQVIPGEMFEDDVLELLQLAA
jgi:thiol-disulfide isomerase/thioredoxin